MPRPPRCRRICGVPQVDTFCPNGCENTGPILLTLDEYEVIRLVDLEQQTHEQCAAQMDISRSTVQEIYESARSKSALPARSISTRWTSMRTIRKRIPCEVLSNVDNLTIRTWLTRSLRHRISASTHMRMENVAAFEKLLFLLKVL